MATPEQRNWHSLDGIAGVTASSEDAAYPIAGPVASPPVHEWRAAEPGPQVVRLTFAIPQLVRRIRLVINETEQERTQEMAIAWWSHADETPRELLRQQFNFSPTGASREIEEYVTQLENVAGLEIRIVPDIRTRQDGPVATLAELRIG